MRWDEHSCSAECIEPAFHSPLCGHHSGSHSCLRWDSLMYHAYCCLRISYSRDICSGEFSNKSWFIYLLLLRNARTCVDNTRRPAIIRTSRAKACAFYSTNAIGVGLITALLWNNNDRTSIRAVAFTAVKLYRPIIHWQIVTLFFKSSKNKIQ